MTDSEKLQEKYISLTASWGEAIKIGDHRTVNKQNNALMKIAKKTDVQVLGS